MASKTWRREWVRGLPWAFGMGRYDRKRIHWASERSVGYVFLIGESVRNYPNPHLYQTGSKTNRPGADRSGESPRFGCQVLVACRYPWSIGALPLDQNGSSILPQQEDRGEQ